MNCDRKTLEAVTDIDVDDDTVAAYLDVMLSPEQLIASLLSALGLDKARQLGPQPNRTDTDRPPQQSRAKEPV